MGTCRFRSVPPLSHRGRFCVRRSSVWIEPAVDAEIIKPEALADHAQRLIMRSIEDGGGIGEECRFLLLHPGLVGHIGRDVVHLPVVSDRKMVGQDLFADEAEFAEMAIAGGGVVDIFDNVVVVVWTPREKSARAHRGSRFFRSRRRHECLLAGSEPGTWTAEASQAPR